MKYLKGRIHKYVTGEPKGPKVEATLPMSEERFKEREKEVAKFYERICGLVDYARVLMPTKKDTAQYSKEGKKTYSEEGLVRRL